MNKMGIIPLLLPAMIFLVGVRTLYVDGEELVLYFGSVDFSFRSEEVCNLICYMTVVKV